MRARKDLNVHLAKRCLWSVDAMSYLYADPLECTGCRICELMCSIHNEKTINPKKARLRVTRVEPAIDMPVACRNCAKPPCAEICPAGAIKKLKNGLVVVNPEKCIGCKACVDACPFGAIYIHPDKHVAIKCTLCGYCVDHCPMQCLHIVTSETSAQLSRTKYSKTIGGIHLRTMGIDSAH